MRTIGALLLVALMAGTASAGSASHLVFAPPPADLAAWCDTLSGLDHSNIVTGLGGGMVWVRGEGEPVLEDGMTDLGTSYTAVWSDPVKRATYDSVYPADEYGKPRPFGVFMGCEEEMGL